MLFKIVHTGFELKNDKEFAFKKVVSLIRFLNSSDNQR